MLCQTWLVRETLMLLLRAVVPLFAFCWFICCWRGW
jgi:hypothetical protein